MNILVINAGSSSVKFTLFDMERGTQLVDGIVERIGLPETRLVLRREAEPKVEKDVDVRDTAQAVALVHGLLTDPGTKLLQANGGLAGIGHRVVHGAEEISRPMLIDDKMKGVIRRCFELAPLHNPPNLEGIEACERHFAGIPQVAVFDTAFHFTLPSHAYLYGLPYEFYEEQGIRRYGFHGISHKHVCHEAARWIGRPVEELKMITCHLGNGCSITAVDGGRSVDTSMGFTPLEGLIMGTRCGDLDPAIVFYLMEHKRMGRDSVNRLLNKQSGMLGLARIGSSDLRDIEAAREDGHPQAGLAIETFCYRIKKYIGAYTAALGRLDVLVFTAGIGENSALIRSLSCSGLGDSRGPGIVLDPAKNDSVSGAPCEIQSPESRVKVLVIPTDEELEIAQETLKIVTAG